MNQIHDQICGWLIADTLGITGDWLTSMDDCTPTLAEAVAIYYLSARRPGECKGYQRQGTTLQ